MSSKASFGRCCIFSVALIATLALSSLLGRSAYADVAGEKEPAAKAKAETTKDKVAKDKSTDAAKVSDKEKNKVKKINRATVRKKDATGTKVIKRRYTNPKLDPKRAEAQRKWRELQLKKQKEKEEKDKAIIEQATHRETGEITIPQGKEKLPIHSFCLDSKGRLLATCGGERLSYVRNKKGRGKYELVKDPATIKVLSPKGKLLETWTLEVTPQSINVAPDGTIYAGGMGKIIKLSPEGKVLKIGDIPNIKELPAIPEIPKEEPKLDLEKMSEEEKAKYETQEKKKKEKAKALSTKLQETNTKMREVAVKRHQAEESKASEEEKNRLAAEYEKLQASYVQMSKELYKLTVSKYDLAVRQRDDAIRKRSVPGIAATEEDLFVACPAGKGYGYEVWRTDLNFENPQKIVSKLSGCCSQMDIQARDGKVWVAENSRKKVRCFDREGKELQKWGEDERKDEKAGFGSCCNPMNIRLDAQGNVYTSESGPGTIKKFDKTGKLLEYVAKAKIVPGCKHVAIAMTKDMTRFYMLDLSRSRIIIFEDLNRVTTHEATGTISIPQGDEKLPIHSFCLDKKGRLLATCGGTRISIRRQRQEDGSYKAEVVEKDDPGMVKVLDADGKLLDTWKLDFQPRAINVAPDGKIYVAGDGRIAKLDENGKVLNVSDAPNVAELGPMPKIPELKEEKLTDEEKAAKEEKLKKLREKQREVSTKLRENYKQRKDATDEDEKVKLAEEREKLTKQYAQLRDQYQMLTYSAREAAARSYQAAMQKRYIPGIAVSDKDIFVAGYPAKGHGFAVWRTDLDFSNPKLVVEGLRGCCRQLDIQCKDGKLWVAENSKKRVTCYDREGKQLVQFGTNERKDKTSGYGFGSCCNPMNLRFNAAGDVYTAEASVGRLKRFSADGKFLGTVAQLKIVPGCKHVAIGVADNGDRIYMLDITRSQIAVVDRKKEK